MRSWFLVACLLAASTVLHACEAPAGRASARDTPDAASAGGQAGIAGSAWGTQVGSSPGAGDGGAAGIPASGSGGRDAVLSGGAPAGSAAGGNTGLQGPPLVYVGCFGSGVRAYELDRQTGALVQRGGDFDAGANPSYLALDASRTRLYAANVNDSAEGGITALAIERDGSLQRINHQTGSDGGFAHLAVSPNGKFLAAAAFNGGSVSVFPIAADGSLYPESDNLDLGDASEAHAVAFVAGGDSLLVPTRGNDRVNQLRLDAEGGLRLNDPPFVTTAQGAGPRHIAIHPDGQLAFLLSEKASTISSYRISPQGTLAEVQTLSTLPPDYVAGNDAAHIELSPDGRFAYASNRGHDSIAVFAVDATSGSLTFVEHEPSRGSAPRDFDVDPNGTVIVVANQESNTLSVHQVDSDGRLTPLGEPKATLSNPTAVLIRYP